MGHKFALGTAQFGLDYGIANNHGQLSERECKSALAVAHGHGIEVLDTAVAYGRSEAVLGNIGISRFRVVTKLPPIPHDVANVSIWVKEQLIGSLERLQIDSVYGLLFHRPVDLVRRNGRDSVEALRSLKSAGLVKNIGVSIYNPSELEYVTQVLDVDLVQAPLNLVDRRLESSGWLSRLKQRGVEVHTRSAFLQGLLLMPRKWIPERFERWSDLWDMWAHELVESGISPVEACLGYPLSHPEVDRVVVGVDSVSQLEQLLQGASRKPERGDWDFMAMDDEQLIDPSRWSEL
jgi:aryl-alcohol dehydrogenase-like predicted oxidoreductase